MDMLSSMYTISDMNTNDTALNTNPLHNIVTEFQDMFRAELPDGPPSKQPITHSIDTNDAKPVNQNTYPLLMVPEMEQVRQVKELCSTGLLKVSNSPGRGPV